MHQLANVATGVTMAKPPVHHEYDKRDLYVELYDGRAVPKTLFERVRWEVEGEVDGLTSDVVLTAEDTLGTEFMDQFGELLRSMVHRIVAHLALRKLVSLELIDCGLGNANFFRVK